MTISAALVELSNAMMVRKRLIERARQSLRENDMALAMVDVLGCLENIQDNERRLLELHAECLGMIQLCHKAVEMEVLRRPVIIKVDGSEADT